MIGAINLNTFDLALATKVKSDILSFGQDIRIRYEFKIALDAYNKLYFWNVNERTSKRLILAKSKSKNMANPTYIILNQQEKNEGLSLKTGEALVEAGLYFYLYFDDFLHYRQKETYIAGLRGKRTVWHNRARSVKQSENADVEYFSLSLA